MTQAGRLALKAVFVVWLIFIICGPALADDRTIKRNKTDNPGAASEQRIALVIGNGNYESSPLRNPVNDAEAMGRTLAQVGFEVIKKTDLNQKEMKRAIDDFGRRLGPESVALFFFAGHGMQVKGHNYLIPVDARIESEEDVEYEAVRADRVLAKMDQARPRVNIVILDACRNNPFARSFRSGSQGLAHMDAPSGTIIAYATAPGSVASDGTGDNGLYTQELVKFIVSPNLPIEEVFKRVRGEVQEFSDRKQVPWESSSLVGNFCFNPGSAPVEEERPVRSVSDIETVKSQILDWAASQGRKDVNKYSSFYSRGFLGVKRTKTGKTTNYNYNEWLRDRLRMIAEAVGLDVTADQIKIISVGEAEIKTEFYQYYRSASYSDYGPKLLYFRKEGPFWKIYYEEMIWAKPLK